MGIDVGAEMVAMSADRARRAALAGRTEFTVGDAAELHFPAQSFDFATAVQVYAHVSDPGRALAEAYRVLRPGGRLVIMDTDWDSCVWQADDRERGARVLRAWEQRFAHPHLPAELPRLIGQAGFVLRSLSAVSIVNLHPDETTYSGSLLEVIGRFVSARGGVPAGEAQAWVEDVRSQDLHGRYFFSLTRFLLLAERPTIGG